MQPSAIPPRRDTPKLVRRIWSEFEIWAAEQRAKLEDESKKVDAKWRSASLWSRQKGNNDAQRAKEIRAAQEKYISSVREEWDRRLKAHKLQDTDWGLMTPQEQDRVFVVLGGDLDEASPIVEKTPEKIMQHPSQPPPRAHPHTPAASTALVLAPAPAPPPASAPMFAPAPLLSPIARSTNSSSTSSYSFVNPSAFTTDDELYEAVSSYITVPTDESESDEPIPIKNPELWGMTSHSLGTYSNRSSQSSSPEPVASTSSSVHGLISYPPSHRPELISAPPRRPPDIAKAVKARLRGPSYVGPMLSDSEESSEEEADFERFKMETRIAKIWEFHHAAAQADVELAMSIYNDRVAKTSSKAGDAAKVAEHEKRMLKLQATKEEERKEVVSAERTKRRDEIRRRAAAREAAKVSGVEISGAQRAWDSFFDHSSTQIDFDEFGRVVHRRDNPSPPDEDESLDILQTPPDTSPVPVPAFVGENGTLRGRPTSVKVPASGWKTKQALSAASPWQSHHTPLPTDTIIDSHIDHSSSFNAHEWGAAADGEGPFEFPGSFPDEATSTPTPTSLSGWVTRKPTGASKLTQVETASPPLDVVPEPEPPLLTSSSKKSNKKRPLPPKKEAASPVLTITKTEAESPTTPTLTPRMPYSKDIHQRLAHQEDEQLSSTPRPQFLPPHMKRSSALTSGYMSDATSTPRAPTQRLDSQVLSRGMTNPATSEPVDESPWQRAQRLGILASGQNPVVKSTMPESTEELLWSRGLRQKVQVTPQVKPSPLGALEEEEGSLWERTMKNKMQASLASMGTQSAVQSVQPADIMDGTPWQRTARLPPQNANPTPTILASVQKNAYTPQISMSALEEEESPWERMHRLKSQVAIPAGAPTSRVMGSASTAPPPPPQEEDSPWQRMQRIKAQGANLGAGTAPPMVSVEPPRQITAAPAAADEESPWQRMARLKAQGVDLLSSSTKPKAPSETPAAARMAHMKQTSWGEATDVEYSDGPSNFHRSQAASKVTNAKQIMWNAGQQAQSGTISKDSKGKRATGLKKVMIEDVPDEEGPSGWKPPDARLPSNSRFLLDIAVPKPSVPPAMFENIIQYGDEEEEEEYDTRLSSAAPTPSTAPTSPPSDHEALDEDWYMSAMEELGKGNWDSLIKKGGPPSSTALPASNKSKKQALPAPAPALTRWGVPAQMKQSNPFSQTIDSAKLMSALEAVDEKPSPIAARISPPKAPPSKTTVAPPPVPVAEKKEPAARLVPAPVPVSAPEPVPAPAKDAKGKPKKGKGRK